MRIDTDEDEDSRRIARGAYQSFVERLTVLWATTLDGRVLSKFPEALADVAWRSMEGRLDRLKEFFDWLDVQPHPQSIWEFKQWLDAGEPVQHPQALPRMRHLFKQLTEWEMGILFLLSAIRIAAQLARQRDDLVPCLPFVLNKKMKDFCREARGASSYIYQNTYGIDYLPERNLSFLGSEIGEIVQEFKGDPRLSEWATQWS